MNNNKILEHPTTTAVHRRQQDASRKARLQALAWLKDCFPEAFDTETRIRPLKIGIIDDIFEHYDASEEKAVSKSKLREALVMFTRRMDYLACVKVRDDRIDLEGNIVGSVSEVHAAHAAETMRSHVDRSIEQDKEEAVEETARVTIDLHPSLEPKKAPAVTIRRKTTRQFDPEVVARLKAKLGIAKKEVATV